MFGVSQPRGCRLVGMARSTTRGSPEEIVLDNDLKFIGRALDESAATHGVRLRFIAPGKPVQDAYIERRPPSLSRSARMAQCGNAADRAEEGAVLDAPSPC
jgi:transposase InsO family protein